MFFSNQRTAISRRRFLELSGAASAATMVPASFAFDSPAQLSRTGNPRRILVLGAGLSGLGAAWELDRAGHDVTLLEARSRPGGRVYTLRDPFADGLYAEAGAVGFSTTYTVANRYIDALGLERAEWQFPKQPQLHHLQGRRFAAGEGTIWPYPMSEDEQKLGTWGLVTRYLLETLPPEAKDPGSWKRLAKLDSMTLRDYLRSQGASPGAIDFIRDTMWFGPAIDRGSALSSLFSDIGLFSSGMPFTLKGGNDRLPTAMADRLGRRIHYGTEVTSIRDLGSGVEVSARRGEAPQTFRADAVICTIPATVLRGMRFEPALPADKRAAIDALPYLDATRTYVQVHRGFWHDEGVSGSALTDLPVGSIAVHPAETRGGPQQRSILESYVWGPAARALAARADEEVLEETLRHMEQVHPAIREHAEGGVVHAWSREPYSLGCVSWPAPGDVTRHLEALQRPHGRIHFAGEHTTILRSTMEGALRSGLRAAEEATSRA